MGAEAPLRVAAFPAGRPGLSNPYAALFAAALREQGAIVDNLEVRALFRSRYDIIHVHWPEWILDGRSRRHKATFLTALAWSRRRGARVVWTVHNIGHHERASRPAQWAWRPFLSMVDGFISLTARGVGVARDAFPALRDTPAFVVPHGHYRDAYPHSVGAEAARARLGIPIGGRVYLFFGQLRPYKGITDLVRAFRALDDPSAVLVVAGRPISDDLRRELERAAAPEPRVHLHFGLVPVDEVQNYFAAADVVVLPYSETFNSGAAMLALSFDRPIIAPAAGAFPELEERLGRDWVATYSGPLSPDILAGVPVPASAQAPLDDYGWDTVGKRVMFAYRSIMGRAQKCSPAS